MAMVTQKPYAFIPTLRLISSLIATPPTTHITSALYAFRLPISQSTLRTAMGTFIGSSKTRK
jgi:hypothetical protein